MKPYITIITSTYNAAGTLRRCLDSVASQSYPNIEHIIIDGNSSDGTQEIIAEYASKPDTRISYWMSEPDSGIYDAWNKALPHITGEWVLFLGADDYYLDDVFSKLAPILGTLDGDIPVAYGKVLVFNEETGAVIRVSGNVWEHHKKHFFRGLRMLPHQGVCHRSSLFREYGGFNATYRIAADYDYLYPIFLENNPVFIDMPIVMYSDGGVSSNIKYYHQCQEEYIQTVKKYGKNPSVILILAVIKVKILLFCESYNLNLLSKIVRKISWT